MDQEIKKQEAEQQPDVQKSALRELWEFVFDLVKVFVIAAVIIFPVRYYVAQPFIVSGSSMEPNFYTGQYLIINELAYHLHDPQRGDIIVFKYPKDTSQYFIKRVIGLPGEKVKIENNHVIIYNQQNPNGFTLDETYLPSTTQTLPVGNGITTLGSDEYFVLGDNRIASSDSRFWGPVPRNDIVGKVLIRAFPFQDFKKFDSVNYQAAQP
ncbi:signal peptidase I [Patescibacteria group bacterium]|nr:signal peptidase I [Patescibacteria group bacterium]